MPRRPAVAYLFLVRSMRAVSVKRHPESERFLCIGDYGPLDAERLLDALFRAHIAFEIECDDGIRFAPTKFGNFGRLAKIRVWIHPAAAERVKRIRTDLFGEFSP